MKTNEKGGSWWLVILTGVLIIAAGIFLLVDKKAGLDTLTFIIGLGVLAYSIYCFYKAIQYKNDNRLFVPYLVHAVLDFVLFLLIFIIPRSAGLMGIILACWLIIFGLLGAIHVKKDGGDRRMTRVNVLLIVIGIAFLILPFVLRIDQVIFLGIIALVFGVIRTVQGIVYKVRLDQHTSGGRSNLM